MENEAAYKEILEAIIHGKILSFGQMAIDKTNETKGIEIDSDGKIIRIIGDPSAIIHEILASFEKISGKTSSIAARIAAADIIKKNVGLTLPAELVK
jgi:hypothetical protein